MGDNTLQGIRVLSLEQVHVLPWGTAFLADFGAEVIRVESATHMNDRLSGPFPDQVPGEEWWNEGGTFAYWARNKKASVWMSPIPRVRRCSSSWWRSDIVTDNFRPGTMQRLGLDHDSLARRGRYHHAELYGLWPHRSLACSWGTRPHGGCRVASRRSRAMKAAQPYGPAATIWTTPAA